MPTKMTYEQNSDPRPDAVNERSIEEDFLQKLLDLKYTFRPDIRDRAAPEKNFREKFESLIVGA